MAQQLPAIGEAFLDHIAHFVPDMDAAAEAFERCGFRLTPFVRQTNRIGGERVPSGTGNRCAMLRCGYIEILAATGETPLAQELRQRIDHHVGLHLAAFSSADAARERQRLAAAGFSVQPLVDMRRPVSTNTGEADARFTIARIKSGIIPEGRVQFLTHHTPDLVWRAADLDHPNGAQALLGLWIAAADLDEAAARFAVFTGRPIEREDDLATVRLDRGRLCFPTPEYLHNRLEIRPGPPLPYFALYEIAVEDLDGARRRLETAGLALYRRSSGIIAQLPPALGGDVLFRAVSD